MKSLNVHLQVVKYWVLHGDSRVSNRSSGFIYSYNNNNNNNTIVATQLVGSEEEG